jgi:hypothetical protein
MQHNLPQSKDYLRIREIHAERNDSIRAFAHFMRYKSRSCVVKWPEVGTAEAKTSDITVYQNQ